MELNDQGQVISGVLACYENLLPAGDDFINIQVNYWDVQPGYLMFNKGDKVTFDESGHVLSGVLERSADIYLIQNHLLSLKIILQLFYLIKMGIY